MSTGNGCRGSLPFRAGHAAVLARSSDGFSLVELTIVVILVALLWIAYIESGPMEYMEQAEKAAMVGLVGTVQGALFVEYAHLSISGSDADIAALATRNPMRLMVKLPDNYVGEFYDPGDDAIAPGNWFFDLKSHEMVYVPKFTSHLESGTNGTNWIRYRVRPVYEPVPGGGGKGALQGILFAPAVPYHWFD